MNAMLSPHGVSMVADDECRYSITCDRIILLEFDMYKSQQPHELP
jgi:hypothetical protein